MEKPTCKTCPLLVHVYGENYSCGFSSERSHTEPHQHCKEHPLWDRYMVHYMESISEDTGFGCGAHPTNG
jgi:hypothetical protein